MTDLLRRPGHHGLVPHEGDGNAAGDLLCSALLSWHTESWTTTRATIVVLSLAGEIDLCSQPQLIDALDEVLAGAPTHLVIDLDAVTFCGAHGLQLLAETTHRGGGTYVLTRLQPHLARIHTLLTSLERPPSDLSKPAAIAPTIPAARRGHPVSDTGRHGIRVSTRAGGVTPRHLSS